MNIQLIERIIRSNNSSCPEFAYKNPLLDKDVARALSKSFVKILNISKQNSNINNNLRLSILENIRKLCQIEPEDHAKVDEKFTGLLTDFYHMKIEESKNTGESAADKELEAFLVRKMKNIAIESSYQPAVNPEIVQALINLNKNGVYFETLSKDVVHWNSKSKLYACLLKDLRKSGETSGNIVDDISIKMKADIERTLLESIQTSLQNKDIDIERVITGNNNLMDLIKQCSISPECFQICSGILNFLFIMTNFDEQIQKFISVFTKLVKSNCAPLKYSSLYPMNLASTVVLLDFDVDSMPEEMKRQYAPIALGDLEQLRNQSENDFVLLLSHFQWFDVYFKTDKINSCSQESNDDIEMIL